jgi:hypothetical protein
LRRYNVDMINIKTTQSINVQDWDALVEKTYKRPYSFQQQGGCQPRGVHNFTVPCMYADDYENQSIPEEVNGDEMGVSFAAWLERDPNLPLNTENSWERSHGLSLFWERNFYPALEVLANDLHALGHLPAGDYQLVIDW